jgi:23S rRNA (uracil1939-C5)-methyltransferase
VPEPVAGSAVVRDTLGDSGLYHYATFGSFVQAHRGQAAALASSVARALEQRLGRLRGARILELFAGSGALGIELCARGAQVVLVERYAPALEHAQRAQREQRLDGLAAISGEAELVVSELARKGERFDGVIVNPPRRGLSPGLRAQLAALAPRAVVYISCEPSSLARDLADLAQHGLRSQGVQPFDMIPLSAGVECLTLLAPEAASEIAVLYEDERLLAVDKPPHLPTIPDPAHASSLLARLQRSHQLPALTAVHRLDVGTSGVCLFAKRRSDVQLLASQLQAGDKHYLALVRGGARAKGIVRVDLNEQGKARAAVSRYSRVDRVGAHTLVRVRPEQGRTHQVRKHMAAIGHPVLGDARYGDGPSNRYFEHKHGLDRTFLHALRVVLAPLGPEAPGLAIEAALAPDLRAVLASLRDSALE